MKDLPDLTRFVQEDEDNTNTKKLCKMAIDECDGLVNDLQSFIDKEDAELEALHNGDLLGGIILGVGFFGTLGVFALLKVLFP